MNESFKLAFDPFSEFDPNKPYRLFPLGMWYRGDRELNITEKRLREMEKHFNDGLPRFRPPVNIEHEDFQGKIGTLSDVQYMPDGEDGSGLYVSVDWSEKGKRIVEEDSFDGVSGEVYWTLANQTYQDPKTGEEYDNVLAGMAVTTKPFFGHDEVAMFSAVAPDGHSDNMAHSIYDEAPYGGATTWEGYEDWVAAQELSESLDKTLGAFTTMSRTILGRPDMTLFERLKGVSDLALSMTKRVKDGGEDGMSDDTQPDEFSGDITEATEELPEDFEADNTAEEEVVEQEKDTMSAEELREKLSASEGKVDELSATIENLTGAIEKMDATQREKDLQARAEAFEAFAIPVDEYVAQMGKLEELDPEVAEWVDAKFAAADKVIGETAVLEELGTDAENEAVGPDKFMQLIDAKRKEDKSSYAEAMKAVTAEHPDLAAEYHLKGMGG